jgi:hypothetical protein
MFRRAQSAFRKLRIRAEASEKLGIGRARSRTLSGPVSGPWDRDRRGPWDADHWERGHWDRGHWDRG